MEIYGNPICCSVAGELVCVVSRQIGGCKAKPYGTIPRLQTVDSISRTTRRRVHGEVGLIFAGVGLAAHIITDANTALF